MLDVYLVDNAGHRALRCEAQTMIAKDGIPTRIGKHFEDVLMLASQYLEAQPLIFIQWHCRKTPCSQPLDIPAQNLRLELARSQVSHRPAYDFHLPRFPPPSRVFRPR